MQQKTTSCFRCVGGIKICNNCDGTLIKHGFTVSGKRRFKCKSCNKTQVETYSYKAYHDNINDQIIQLTKEGVGIRSTARILKISATTLLKRMLSIARNTRMPPISKGKTYEVDEIRTFVKRKDRLIWIVYALERSSKKIVSFNIGPRTNKTLNVTIKMLEHAEARRIYTDGLRHYRYLIDQKFIKQILMLLTTSNART